MHDRVVSIEHCNRDILAWNGPGIVISEEVIAALCRFVLRADADELSASGDSQLLLHASPLLPRCQAIGWNRGLKGQENLHEGLFCIEQRWLSPGRDRSSRFLFLQCWRK